MELNHYQTILMKHLTNLGQMWPKYLPLATFTYNTLNTLNLVNYSPYELVFGKNKNVTQFRYYTRHQGVGHIERLSQIIK